MNWIESNVIAFCAGSLIGYVYFWIWKPRREAAKKAAEPPKRYGPYYKEIKMVPDERSADNPYLKVLFDISVELRERGLPHFQGSETWRMFVTVAHPDVNTKPLDEWRRDIELVMATANDYEKLRWRVGYDRADTIMGRLDAFLPSTRRLLAHNSVDFRSKLAIELQQRVRVAAEQDDVDIFEIDAYVLSRIRTATEAELQPVAVLVPDWRTQPITKENNK